MTDNHHSTTASATSTTVAAGRFVYPDGSVYGMYYV